MQCTAQHVPLLVEHLFPSATEKNGLTIPSDETSVAMVQTYSSTDVQGVCPHRQRARGHLRHFRIMENSPSCIIVWRFLGYQMKAVSPCNVTRVGPGLTTTSAWIRRQLTALSVLNHPEVEYCVNAALQRSDTSLLRGGQRVRDSVVEVSTENWKRCTQLPVHKVRGADAEALGPQTGRCVLQLHYCTQVDATVGGRSEQPFQLCALDQHGVLRAALRDDEGSLFQESPACVLAVLDDAFTCHPGAQRLCHQNVRQLVRFQLRRDAVVDLHNVLEAVRRHVASREPHEIAAFLDAHDTPRSKLCSHDGKNARTRAKVEHHFAFQTTGLESTPIKVVSVGVVDHG
mmetsp:Transcript_51308/g.136934  ORF Transcript_51308/g.136934 Transcript_51308/m.136934 type:complete len:344 (-) Transcript_51308:93-1124(-)